MTAQRKWDGVRAIGPLRPNTDPKLTNWWTDQVENKHRLDLPFKCTPRLIAVKVVHVSHTGNYHLMVAWPVLGIGLGLDSSLMTHPQKDCIKNYAKQKIWEKKVSAIRVSPNFCRHINPWRVPCSIHHYSLTLAPHPPRGVIKTPLRSTCKFP